MTELVKIANCEDTGRLADVVFVHGLDGDARTSWEHAGEKEYFWPAWIGEDLPGMGVWSLDYEVSSSSWRGSTMPLTDRATNTLEALTLADIGMRPLVFIAHSYGGLLVKQILRHADSHNSRWRPIVKQTKGVIFLSTPHGGANLASWIQNIGKMLRTTSTVEELRAHEPYLRDLNFWYRNNVDRLSIKSKVYFEARKTTLGVVPVLIVDPGTADPGIPCVIPIPMDEDHRSICKPRSRESLLYQGVIAFIQQCLSERPLGGHKDITEAERAVCQKASLDFYKWKVLEQVPSLAGEVIRKGARSSEWRHMSAPKSFMFWARDVYTEQYLIPLIKKRVEIEEELRGKFNLPFPDERLTTLWEEIIDLIDREWEGIVYASYTESQEYARQEYGGDLPEYKARELEDQMESMLRVRPSQSVQNSRRGGKLFDLVDAFLRSAQASSVLRRQG